jgi:transcriptional regulator with XRE-family HTH domain
MQPEATHLVQTLRTAIRVLGFTHREVEKRLGVAGGYLSRLFSGVMELRFQHIVDIGRVLGLEPEEIFHLAYPQPRNPPSEAAQRLRDVFEGGRTVPAPPATASAPESRDEDDASPMSRVLEAELQKMMMRTFRKMFEDLEKSGSR